jgi:RNA polymerase sigma factor for flagellar operon FliA
MSAVAMYAAVQSSGGIDQQIAAYAPLVKRIAHHLMNRLPDSVQVDDLIQAGMLGLLEASKNFDPTQGASFETFAGIRIKGAMLDEVRRSDWTPRSVHKNSRRVSEAIHAIESQTQSEARDADIAKHLGLSVNEYNQILQDSISCRLFSVEELTESEDHHYEPGSEDGDPLSNMVQDGFQQALASAILGLPERERLVISLYYNDELNLREIGEVLGISESRVSQICTQATLRLRSRLAEWTGVT